MSTMEQAFPLAAADGYPIEAMVWRGSDAGAPRGAVQIVHGMAEHARRYRHVAEALVRAGYVVYASNHRGHGAHAQELGTLGDFGAGGFASLVDDMAVLTRHIRASHPGVPMVMLAHSMGSMAAQIYLLDHADLLDAVALSGTTALELLDPRVSGWTVESANATVPDAQSPVDWLSRDPAVPAAYLADPLCAFPLTEASLFSIFDTGARTADPAELARLPKDLPFYLFTGACDPVNGHLAWFDPLVLRLRQSGLRNLSTHVYGGARHEVLNETNRAEVIANLLAWLERVTAR
ncbi:alpha/beta fold hydrolase [Oxalobacteraceae bacterium]|nr:alpha/beta fold hydrolase [Oxalobacteraceae bacterium]